MNIGSLMALVIIAILIAICVRAINPAISSVISIAICVLIVSICVSRINTIIGSIRTISKYISIDKQYMVVLFKLIGIAYICEFASGISKDAGYSAVASEIELVGKLTMLMVSLPIFFQVIDTIMGIM